MGQPTCWISLLVVAVVSAQKDFSCPPDTCGENAICRMLDGVPKCECPEGRYGNPWKRCMARCEKDSDCSSNWFCEKYYCRPVCSGKTCGPGAECSVIDHRPVCECLHGLKGDPRVRCSPECTKSSECPDNMVCNYPTCMDPCYFSCGKDALCEVSNHKTFCRCPRGMAGNALERCRPMTPEDLCSPNPCGKNADCSPGKDDEENPVASCSCPPGYYGSPLIECVKGDCITDTDCSSSKICRRSQCIDPCIELEDLCPPSSTCTVKSHRVFCLMK